ncbi:methylmalonyl Co-A mutase-associated GTPase MeaB [Algivirga pacifica]|uniref:Methylmalonyl Co-A mutase-associated GTPase MeaB n=1 Tax=Algivirga pacifica TaxID=1162670 RepID=A0ABP9DF67_9BACT
MKQYRRTARRHPIQYYIDGILNGNRITLSQAITLAESQLPSDQQLSESILTELLPHTGKSIRIGITGVPGVGKSTFIEAFGALLTQEGYKVAVLTIDPSSPKTKGSILGDKTRMEKLAANPMAYIRPSASGNTLGGVAAGTKESILLCEAAGYDVILVETVGVGQSEISIRELTDFFLLLMLAGAGDELQGIKKGIMEMADTIAITKADGDNITASKLAKKSYQNALHLFAQSEQDWYPKVFTCSALEGNGMHTIWKEILRFESHMKERGYFQQRRKEQDLYWMHQYINEQLHKHFYQDTSIQKMLSIKKDNILNGEELPIQGAKVLLEQYFSSITKA